jgi:adenylate cyclase
VTYDYFRRGMQYFRRRSAKDTAYAREMFEKAIHQENDYGPAWAGLAYTYGFECLSFNRTQAVRRRARRFSTKALQLSPGLSTSYVAKGIVNLLDSRASAAHEAFEIATAIEPQNFEAWYFNACNWARAGDPAKAISLFEKASGCDEQDFQSVLMQSQLYQSLGDTGGSMKALQHGLEVARTSLERRPDNYRALNLGAIALLQLGMREEGLEWMERSLANAPRDAIMEYNAACFFSVSGDIARSLKHLDRCRLMGRIDEDWLNHDSNLDAVKESPEFKRRIMAAPVAANLPVVTQPGAVGADTLHTIR